jgi:RNA polymerase sigma factor (sigma-70 family)
MDDLIKLVKTYRLTAGLAERIRLAEEIFRLIGPDLHLFVFSTVPHHAAQDVYQEVLKAVATGLKKFQGDTAKEFWAWCYRIARNKLNDHYRSKAADRMHPMPPEDLWQMMEASAQTAPMSPAVRHDLEYAMKLLTNSKPECYDFLWNHFVFGLDYGDIAEDRNMSYDNVRMKIVRCLEEAKALVS